MLKGISMIRFAVFFVFLAGIVSAKTTISIVQLSQDERIDYGISVLKNQIEQQDFDGMIKLIVGLKDDPELTEHLNETELNQKTLETAEGFLVKRVGEAEGGTIIIVGSEPKGAMYGCLDITEKLRIMGYNRIPTFFTSAPVMELRSYDFNYPTFIKGCSWNDNPHAAKRLAAWFYDKEKIIPFLDKLAEAKFNTMKIDGTHLFPALVPIPGYPEALEDVVEKSPLTVEKLQKERIPYLRWLFAECRRRGITPYIGFFNVWVPESVMKNHGIDREGKNNYHIEYPEPEAAAYTKAAVKAFSDAYGDLVGLFVWNMESIPQGTGQLQNKWLRENIIGGLLESSNRPPCILAPFQNALSDDRVGIEEILKSYNQLKYFSADCDGENTITPDLNSVYFDLFNSFKGKGSLRGGIANANMGGWGSGNIVPYPWFLPDYIKKSVDFLESHGFVGSTSFPMRGIWYPDYYERDWLWISGLGKFLWDNSGMHTEYFNDLVKERYGCSKDSAEAILNAYGKSGEIPVLFASQFFYFVCTLRYQFGAPLEYGIWPGDLHLAVPGMLLADSPRNDWGGYALWTKPHPELIKRKKLVDIVEYVKGDDQAEITPDHLSKILEEDAIACLENIKKAASEITRRETEFEELSLNMQAYHYMGLHFSEKTKGLLSMLRYLRTGDNTLYDAGKAHLKESLEYFLKQRTVSQKVYPNPDKDLIFQVAVPSIRHDWDSILPILKDEIENYDKYLVRCAMHLAADRKNSVGPGTLRDLFRRVTPGTVNIWHPWWGPSPDEYWNNTDNMRRYWKRWNKEAMMPLMPTEKGMVPVVPVE